MDELNRPSVDEFKDLPKIPVIIILENIRSGLNVGSIFRSADAFRVERIVCTGYTPCPPHREVLKTALGATESVLWEQSDISSILDSLHDDRTPVWAVEQTHNSIPLHEFEFPADGKLALVLGNEVSGVSEDTLTRCRGAIEITQLGTKHSLNVAVSAGIVLHLCAMRTGGFS